MRRCPATARGCRGGASSRPTRTRQSAAARRRPRVGIGRRMRRWASAVDRCPEAAEARRPRRRGRRVGVVAARRQHRRRAGMPHPRQRVDRGGTPGRRRQRLRHFAGSRQQAARRAARRRLRAVLGSAPRSTSAATAAPSGLAVGRAAMRPSAFDGRRRQVARIAHARRPRQRVRPRRRPPRRQRAGSRRRAAQDGRIGPPARSASSPRASAAAASAVQRGAARSSSGSGEQLRCDGNAAPGSMTPSASIAAMRTCGAGSVSGDAARTSAAPSGGRPRCPRLARRSSGPRRPHPQRVEQRTSSRARRTVACACAAAARLRGVSSAERRGEALGARAAVEDRQLLDRGAPDLFLGGRAPSIMLGHAAAKPKYPAMRTAHSRTRGSAWQPPRTRGAGCRRTERVERGDRGLADRGVFGWPNSEQQRRAPRVAEGAPARPRPRRPVGIGDRERRHSAATRRGRRAGRAADRREARGALAVATRWR